MKRVIIFLVLAAVSVSAFAQRAPRSSSYKDIKGMYSPRNYVKSDVDPYSVFWSGFESFVVPGMGQLIMKEPGRGWSFIGGSFVLNVVGSAFAQNLIDLAEKDSDGKFVIPEDKKDKAKGYFAALGGVALGELVLSIWSCADAVKVAKVKNQYYQDSRKHAFSATMYPSVDLVQVGSNVTPTAGMTFAVKF